ncbi:MAG: glycosyltransferase [Planctomycetes bacterium]|nr:glycosyltransferase [Planctomycetota bacterium]
MIPTYKEAESVRRAVESLFTQDLDKGDYEVIVVDSTPDDSVVTVVRALQPTAPCKLLLLKKLPEGPGPSRRLGVEHARGDILAFIDSDCLATPGWLREGTAAFADGVGLVQGRTLPEPGVPLGIFSWYVRVERENHVYECANIFYRRAAYDSVGGFDPAYKSWALHPLGGEDVDLAWRVKRAGCKSRFCAQAVACHEVQSRAIGRWIWIKQLYIWPRLVGKFPELRRHMFGRYFFDRHQAWLVLGLAGVVASVLWTPWGAVLWLPYVVSRGSEPTRSLPGPLRLLRVLAYLARDVASLLILSAGSIRHRTLLL